MRRAVAGVVLLVARAATAAPWTFTAEASAELDTNVQRVETGPGIDVDPITSPVALLGVHVDHHDSIAGGGYVLSLGSLVRLVTDPDASTENVALLSGDLRWLHPVGDRPVAVGLAATFADALPLTDPIGARTFRNLGADAIVVLRGKPDRALTLSAGVRQFQYKPDPTYDWFGPTFSARFDLSLWQAPAGTRSLDLAVTAGFEARTYDSLAQADGCPPDATPDPSCFAATSLTRRDRFQRAGVDLTYVGRQVIALGYQATVIDSNSFGESLLRHRITAGVTTALPGGLYATALAALQIDQYLDGLLVAADLLNMSFTNLDDENRSSLQLRVAKPMTPAWSIEARVAAWRDLDAPTTAEFHRELYSIGVVYSE